MKLMNLIYVHSKEIEKKNSHSLQENTDTLLVKMDLLSTTIQNQVIQEVKDEIKKSQSLLKNEVILGVAKAVMNPMVIEGMSTQIRDTVQKSVSQQLEQAH